VHFNSLQSWLSKTFSNADFTVVRIPSVASCATKLCKSSVEVALDTPKHKFVKFHEKVTTISSGGSRSSRTTADSRQTSTTSLGSEATAISTPASTKSGGLQNTPASSPHRYPTCRPASDAHRSFGEVFERRSANFSSFRGRGETELKGISQSTREDATIGTQSPRLFVQQWEAVPPEAAGRSPLLRPLSALTEVGTEVMDQFAGSSARLPSPRVAAVLYRQEGTLADAPASPQGSYSETAQDFGERTQSTPVGGATADTSDLQLSCLRQAPSECAEDSPLPMANSLCSISGDSFQLRSALPTPSSVTALTPTLLVPVLNTGSYINTSAEPQPTPVVSANASVEPRPHPEASGKTSNDPSAHMEASGILGSQPNASKATSEAPEVNPSTLPPLLSDSSAGSFDTTGSSAGGNMANKPDQKKFLDAFPGEHRSFALDGSLFSQRSYARYDVAGQKHRRHSSPAAAWLHRHRVPDFLVCIAALGWLACLVWLVAVLCR